MDLRKVVSELKRERDSIDRAIAALEAIASSGVAATVGKASAPANISSKPAMKKAKKHNISAEGRKRLSDMMKKRWAERRRKLASGHRQSAKAA